TYQATVSLNTAVTGATGGSGVPIVVVGAPVSGGTITVNQPTDTPTPTQTATVTPTPTITNTPIPFVFTVSQNVLTDATSPVSIHASYPQSGKYEMKVYNSVGEFIKDLDPGTNPSGQDHWFTWDGTNYLGQKCASGIYVIYYLQPLGVKEAKILLLR
ncbi:MAG TPA: FlgD immunoglobulin-like domain containing protein, partial [bacterium]|nr:FlgD immunoglobulin-like domain containing protein [bacterium]